MLDVDCLRPYLPGNTTCHSPEKAGVMLMEITTNDRSYFDKCRRREAQLTRPVGRVTTGQSLPPPKKSCPGGPGHLQNHYIDLSSCTAPLGGQC